MKNRYLGIALLLVLLLSALLPAALAEGKVELVPQVFWAGEQPWSIGLENAPDNAKLISVKSSNPKVLKVSGEDVFSIGFDPLQPGKSKVTVKYSVGKKVSEVSAVFTVRKFPSVFKTLKFNGKSIQPTYAKNIYEIDNYKKTSATFTYKLKSTWKLLTAALDIEGQERVPLVSGKSFKIPKGKESYIVVDAQEKKTGAYIVFFIHIYR